MSSPPDDDEVAGHVIFDDSDEESPGATDHEPDSASGSESDSDSHDEHENNGMFDLEASEEEEDDSENQDEYDEEDNEDDWDDHNQIRHFPQFTRFPPEIRLRVWELFCPDLTATGRVYELPYHTGGDKFLLASRTASARAVLATHRHSRDFALKAFPDTLSLGNSPDSDPQLLRFHNEKDIIFIRFPPRGLGYIPQYPGYAYQVRNLAIEMEHFAFQYLLPQPVSRATTSDPPNTNTFPRPENLFFIVDGNDCYPNALRWCASDRVKVSSITTFEETFEERIRLAHHEMYCWPDVGTHRDFFEKEIPLNQLWRNACLPEYPGTDSDSVDSAVQQQVKSLPVWPLVRFAGERGIERFENLCVWNGNEEDWDGSQGSSDDDESEPDDYESSGIDDDEIAEGTEDEEEDDLAVLDDERATEGEEDDTAEFGGFSPLEGESGTLHLIADVQLPSAQFSSPEPESAAAQEESDDSDSDQPAARAPAKRSRKRVLDDSDEEDEDEEAPRKRARFVRRVEDSDDEDEDVPPPSIRREEESDEESSEELDESEESEEESDEEPDEAAAPRTMSLAERLQLHRRQNPVPDEQDSDLEDGGSDEDGIPGYADFDDDEDDEGGSEDGHEELIIDLNEDGDEGEEEY